MCLSALSMASSSLKVFPNDCPDLCASIMDSSMPFQCGGQNTSSVYDLRKPIGKLFFFKIKCIDF